MLDFGTANSDDLELDPLLLDLSMVDGHDGAVLSLRSYLQTFQGEWWLDPTKGLPYYAKVLGQTEPDLVAIRSIYIQAISQHPDISEIISLSTDFLPETQTYTVKFQARDIYGETIEMEI